MLLLYNWLPGRIPSTHFLPSTQESQNFQMGKLKENILEKQMHDIKIASHKNKGNESIWQEKFF